MQEHEWWDWKERITEAMVRCGAEVLECRPGPADDAVEDALSDELVRQIADEISPDNRFFLSELRETGAWSEPGELDDHEVNLQRMVWMLAGEWKDELDEATRED